MPEVAEAPKVNPSLAALFEIPDKPNEAPPEAAAPAAPAAPPPADPAATPTAEPAAPAEPAKPDALRSRLAPDFDAPPAAAAAPAAEDHPEITEEIIAAETDPKKQANLRAMGKRIEQLKRELTEVRSKPAAAAAPVEGENDVRVMLERVTQERDEILGRLERQNLMESPKFQADFIQPRQRLFIEAQELIKTYGNGDVDALGRAMSLTGKARVEVLEEISEGISSKLMQDRFGRLVDGMDEKTKAINEKVQDAKRTAEELRLAEAKTKNDHIQKTEAEWGALLDNTMRDFRETHKLETLIKVDDPAFDWWNKEVEQVEVLAKDVLMKATPEKAAAAAVLAPCALLFRSMYQNERAARLASEKELAEYKAGGPRISEERRAAKAGTDGYSEDDIIGRLNQGQYRK